MEWMEVNGVALRYAVSGGGDKDLVLVHELGGALESWNDVLPALEKEFRVLRYDQRGFGLGEVQGHPQHQRHDGRYRGADGRCRHEWSLLRCRYGNGCGNCHGVFDALSGAGGASGL